MLGHCSHLPDGGNTPLHTWLSSANFTRNRSYFSPRPDLGALEDERNIAILRFLQYPVRADSLTLLHGAGIKPLHSAVAPELPEQTRLIAKSDPGLLHRESTVGRTPAEITDGRFIATRTVSPRSVDTGASTTMSS